MRRFLSALTLAALIPFGTIGLTGCGGGGDEVLEHDPAESERRGAEYEQQMREAMQRQGRPVPPSGGN